MRKYLQERLEKKDVEKFLQFPGEELILATREHIGPLAARILDELIIAVPLSIALPVIAYVFLHSVVLSLELLLVAIFITAGLAIRQLVHWYFHLYIVTTRKIAEVSYSPLSSELSNSILLDQLRCTEIDAEMHGVISEVFDIGNVVITFDRPTHQEEFTLRKIRSPRKVADMLSLKLYKETQESPNQIWVGRRKASYPEEIHGTVLPN